MTHQRPTSDKMWQRSSTHIRFNDKDMDFNFMVPLAFGSEHRISASAPKGTSLHWQCTVESRYQCQSLDQSVAGTGVMGSRCEQTI